MGTFLKAATIALSRQLTQAVMNQVRQSPPPHFLQNFKSDLKSALDDFKADFKIASVQLINLFFVKAIAASLFTAGFLLTFFEVLRQIETSGIVQGTVYFWGSLGLTVLGGSVFLLTTPRKATKNSSLENSHSSSVADSKEDEVKPGIVPSMQTTEEENHREQIYQHSPELALVKTDAVAPLSFPNPSATDLILQELKVERDLFFSRQ